MNGYSDNGVDDDRLARAATRIVRQYHIEQHDRSEDSGSRSGSLIKANTDPDNPHHIRLALDEMTLKIEHMQRLMAKREDLFFASLERLERNLAKCEGAVDALAAGLARQQDQPSIEISQVLDDQHLAMQAIMAEYGDMMVLSRTLLQEVLDLHEEKTSVDISAPSK